MASVTLSSRTLKDARLAALMERLRIARAEALGIVSLFWLSSREAGLEATAELGALLPLVPYVANRAPELVCEALMGAGYISQKEPGAPLVITDNAGHLAGAQKRQEAARAAGKASAALRARKRKPAKTKELAPKTGPNPNIPAWEAYAEAYRAHYGQLPLRNMKANSLIAQFVKRVGQAEAPAVLAFYLKHTDLHYVHKMHPLEFAVKDAEALHAQWSSGKVMTYARARQAERGDNAQTLAVKGQLAAIERGEI